MCQAIEDARLEFLPLEKSGVKYHFNHTVKDIHLEDGKIKVKVRDAAGNETVIAEFAEFNYKQLYIMILLK